MKAECAMFRDIVVQLTGSTEDEVRLACARRLAHDYNAHLVGVHLHTLPDILDITDPLQSGTVRALLEASDKSADLDFARLQGQFSDITVSHELLRLHGLAAQLGAQLAEIARSADLFIGTRPYGDPAARGEIEEKVTFGSGRGCLFLPPGGSHHTGFDTVSVAWDGSREASRALAEAMPILCNAKSVRLVSIVTTDDEKNALRMLGRVKAHLGRHGVQSETELLNYASSPGEQIEQNAHQRGAQLIVMGAYGHGRMTEWIFGGATRYLLRHSTLPVFMAH